MSIELLDTETEGQGSDQEEETRKYASYVDRFIAPGDEISDECRNHLTKKPVFLPRSIRSYNNSPYGKMREASMQNHHNVNNSSTNASSDGNKSASDSENKPANTDSNDKYVSRLFSSSWT